MYFHAEPPIVANPIEFDNYLSDFHFAKYVYKDKSAAYEQLLSSDSGFLADLAGAVFATLCRAGYTHKDVYKRAIECCRDIIVAQGFKETDDDQARSFLRPNGSEGANHIVVAGCQDPEMLNRRVERAADFVTQLGYNCVVVFSGKNPDPTGTKNVRILDESQRMRVLFKELLRKNESARLPPMHDLRGEGASSTTQTNIAKFFDGEFFTRAKNNNLIIVSSTFHLIRLAREIQRELIKDANTGKVARIVLVGAESPTHFFTVQDAGYLKLMMFDVFHYLLRNTSNATNAA